MEALTIQERAKAQVRQYLAITGRKGLKEFREALNAHAERPVCTLKTLNLWLKTEGRTLGPHNWKYVSAFLESENVQGMLALAGSQAASSSNPGTPRYAPQTFSHLAFSEGLHQALASYNSELQYLTIEQVQALASHLRHQNLWIQGAAGTGKTIFAIEAAYRALRAGSSVLMVFRSRQFFHILGELLDEVSDQLTLLLHLDFLYLLRQLELHGPESAEFRQIAQELMPKGEQTGGGFHFDLVIVDDCGTYETQMPYLIRWIDEIAYKKIYLVAPEQIVDNLIPEDIKADAPALAKGLRYRHIAQSLSAPEHFHTVQLTKNVRNCRSIVRYAQRHLGIQASAAIREAGRFRTLQCNWNNLDQKLLAVCGELLKTTAPSQIRILVDPLLLHPDFDAASVEISEENLSAAFAALSPLTQGIVLASRGVSFLHSTFECEEELVEAVLDQASQSGVIFLATDGEEIVALDQVLLSPNRHAEALLAHYPAWPSPHIDARKILDEYALADPLQTAGAILIYPTPLFIGLEADAVIYVSSSDDDDAPAAKATRATHHFLAMSRAKLYLVSVKL